LQVNPHAGERDESFEGIFGYFVAGSESTETLEFTEAAFVWPDGSAADLLTGGPSHKG
jgi:hypothetical protein